MNTKNIHSTVTKWASETDERIQVELVSSSSNWEWTPETRVTLRIRDEITRDRPYLGMMIPHARRTAFYIYGPNEDELVEEDYHFPSFEDESDLRIALRIIYQRFMIEHGMQRFDNFKEPVPEMYHPNLLDKTGMWILQKARPKYAVSELAPSVMGGREGGVELHPVGKNPSGLFIRIKDDRTNPQKFIQDKSGKVLRWHLPAFFTESELIGALEYASRYIDKANNNIKKSKS